MWLSFEEELRRDPTGRASPGLDAVQVALRFTLGYFRFFPPGRVQLILSLAANGSNWKNKRGIHAIACLETCTVTGIQGAGMMTEAAVA